MDNHNKKFAIALTITIILLAGGGFLMINRKNEKKIVDTPPIDKIAACTMEAKICPDGSAVGRTAPNCEFASCPTNSATNNWLVFVDQEQNFSWRYPEKLETKYVTSPSWPPIVKISQEKFSCISNPEVNATASTTVIKMIEGQAYCIHQESEGAAGSVFITKNYTTEKDGKLISLSSVLQYPQCLNYDEPQKTACQKEQEQFSMDDLAKKIISSIK